MNLFTLTESEGEVFWARPWNFYLTNESPVSLSDLPVIVANVETKPV
ncbi:hypothetical protein GCM10027190_20380 [Spirosoma areae]